MLDVALYNLDGDVIETFYDADDDAVDYVSLVSPETYGPPALVAPSHNSGRAPTAIRRSGVGECVLYINTSLVPFWTIERTSH